MYIQKNSEKGITMITLAVTIIVLIILASVSINMLVGENGIITQSQRAEEDYSKSEVKEKVELALSEYTIEKTTEKDSNFASFLRKSLHVGVVQNEDGSYSFALGEWQVETTENGIISIEKLDIKVDKVYETVANMKADVELTEGKLVQTEGYWSKTYGGGAYYDIVSSTSIAVDDGKCLQLDNGLYAELHAINDTVTVNQFGAYGDGEHDDATFIQKALDSGCLNIEFYDEQYNVQSTLYIKTDNISIIGKESTVINNVLNLNSIFYFMRYK